MANGTLPKRLVHSSAEGDAGALRHSAEPAGGETAELLAAIEVCRKRRAKSLLADLPGYGDLDGKSWLVDGAMRQPVEVECISRPKSAGGTRLEVVPDFETSVRLQLVAARLMEHGLDLPHSASAVEAAGGQGAGYALWSETIPMWVRHMLVAGLTVVAADVEDYFGSLPASKIAFALRDARLDPTSIGEGS
ncbi:MAG: hypothetical protein OXH09_04835 [Gammaproteobacteria bacterium]|nr:hypothetical protein [Gammaproteobacteria bacterium]